MGVTRAGTWMPSSVFTRRIWPNLFAFGKVPTVPGNQEVTAVEGCEGEMERVTRRIRRHHVTGDVGTDDVDYGGLDGENRQGGHQLEAFRTARVVAVFELVDGRVTGHQLPTILAVAHHLRATGASPPYPRPCGPRGRSSGCSSRRRRQASWRPRLLVLSPGVGS